MKKMKLVALSAVLCLVLGMTVNAEGSAQVAYRFPRKQRQLRLQRQTEQR